MQTVGAQWMLIHQPKAATLVSIVQAASLLPVMFVSLPAGVLADLLDRRQILLAAQGGMAAIAALLTGLTAVHLTTPALLITMTFLLGCGQALASPAWQAIQPMLVPREQLPAAAALNSMNVNISRAIGPALAGVIVAVWGPWVVFAINAVSFSGVLLALARWHEPPDTRAGTQPFLSATWSGTRYLRHAPGVRRILLRAALFVVPASALWALLAIVASQQLRIGSGGYGLLLGALGAGAVAGALAISRIRQRMSPNAILVLFSLVFAAGTAIAGTVRDTPAVVVVMFASGIAWLAVLSTLNTSMQLSLPAWVRARGLSGYLVVFMGGQGLGSLLWGTIAGPLGTPATLVTAGAALAAGVVTFAWLPLHSVTGTLDRTIAHFPEPVLAVTPAPADGPVVVALTYRVPAARADSFTQAMRKLAVSRQRTGATRWGLFRDAADPEHYVELFEVPSWSEHQLQHSERVTGFDADLLSEAKQYAAGDPEVHHLIATLADAANGQTPVSSGHHEGEMTWQTMRSHATWRAWTNLTSRGGIRPTGTAFSPATTPAMSLWTSRDKRQPRRPGAHRRHEGHDRRLPRADYVAPDQVRLRRLDLRGRRVPRVQPHGDRGRVARRRRRRGIHLDVASSGAPRLVFRRRTLKQQDETFNAGRRYSPTPTRRSPGAGRQCQVRALASLEGAEEPADIAGEQTIRRLR